MASFAKASKVNQRVHKERHQPAARAHLGLLEKKEDYKFRANDYNRKQKVIKRLRDAALNRNPDEFYFHMVNSGTKDGKHFEKKPDLETTLEQKKIMENKTLAYVSMKRTVEAKKVERLHNELHLVDVAGNVQNQHIRFDGEGESTAFPTNTEAALGLNNSSLSEYKLNRLLRKKHERYQELARRIDRKNKLTTIQQKMEIAQALANDRSTNPPKLVVPQTKSTAAVYQWKYERKR